MSGSEGHLYTIHIFKLFDICTATNYNCTGVKHLLKHNVIHKPHRPQFTIVGMVDQRKQTLDEEQLAGSTVIEL